MVRRWRGALLALALALALADQALGCCDNKCSGHGACLTGTCTCSCHAQWAGADCSLRQCPSGLQWVGDASATDTVHNTLAVCSNAGVCSSTDGVCNCADGFQGLACERMNCPLNCNDHGRCVSIRDAGLARDDRNFFRAGLTYNSWEASRIYGCQCEPGWGGYDCSLRECPTGDDPLTTGQQDEVQVLECFCDATCSGNFYLSFRGESTKPISFDASAANIKAALEELVTLREVTVAFTGGTVACDSDGVATAITFTHNPGDVPPLRIAKNALATTGSTAALTVYHSGEPSSLGVATQTGDKEDVTCNGRGTCDTDTGLCTCESDFASSDGAGASGYTGDCGYHTGGASACPGATSCSGHGTCSGASDYLCTCYDGWGGRDCSQRRCPLGKAWFAEPGVSLPGYVTVTNSAASATTTQDLRSYIKRGDTVVINGESLTVSTNTGDTFDATTLPFASAYGGSTVTYVEAYARPEEAHHLVECSNRGLCDRNMGTCTCQVGFTGRACQRTKCPSNCNGRGLCMDVADFATSTESNGDATAYTYGDDPTVLATWDHDMLFGCRCDKSLLHGGHYDYFAADCSQIACQVGDDPSTVGVDEVQTISCDATGGSFTLTFRQQTTAAIAYNADTDDVKAALEALSTIGLVSVTFSSGTEVCASGGVDTTVTFLDNHGDLPDLVPANSLTGGAATVSVAEATSGTKETAECSSHGLCDRATGACKCFSGYVSSDGQGNAGTRGDCSGRDALYVKS